jgi:hypothetical protein
MSLLKWIPIFTNPATVNIIFNSLKFLQKEGLKINAFVILENHMHFILQVFYHSFALNLCIPKQELGNET